MMRVLVADDEAPARGKLQRWLSEQSDIEVVAESEDGLHAAEAIERLKPDVAFLDIQMPGSAASKSRLSSNRRPRR